jgi:DNA-binding NarL/FixJ family response regulator
MPGPGSSTRRPSGALATVVIVDDCADIRLLLRVTLDLYGELVVVGEGADGRAAIELAGDLRPGLVLLDHHMPGLTGLEALPEIRRASPVTTVVLYTADVDPQLREAALLAGAAAVLDKTTVTIDLVDALAGVMAEADGSREDEAVPAMLTPVSRPRPPDRAPRQPSTGSATRSRGSST